LSLRTNQNPNLVSLKNPFYGAKVQKNSDIHKYFDEKSKYIYVLAVPFVVVPIQKAAQEYTIIKI
jgi:hypothetical protein